MIVKENCWNDESLFLKIKQNKNHEGRVFRLVFSAVAIWRCLLRKIREFPGTRTRSFRSTIQSDSWCSYKTTKLESTISRLTTATIHWPIDKLPHAGWWKALGRSEMGEIKNIMAQEGHHIDLYFTEFIWCHQQIRHKSFSTNICWYSSFWHLKTIFNFVCLITELFNKYCFFSNYLYVFNN